MSIGAYSPCNYSISIAIHIQQLLVCWKHKARRVSTGNHTVFKLFSPQRFYKKAAANVLPAVAKHSPELAQSEVDSRALDALDKYMEEFDTGVKESAAWALGYIARHNAGWHELCYSYRSVLTN